VSNGRRGSVLRRGDVRILRVVMADEEVLV